MAGINFDFTTGSLPGGITFTRASNGTYNSSGNILTTASSDVARFNYIGGVSNLLIEPAATNLLTQSNNFAVDWNAGLGATLASAQFVSPDGTNNGWAMTSIPTNGYVYELINYAAAPYTLSIWGKLITAGVFIQLLIAGSGAPVALTSTTTRLAATITPASGVATALIELVGADGSMGMYGAQLETGSVMTSYIPTTTATVTRAADSATFTIPSGVPQLTYTFDDNSTQVVAVISGSYTIPANLNRPNIKTIVGPQTSTQQPMATII